MAIRDFDAVLERDRDNATFFYYRGTAYEQKQDYESAIADLTEAAALFQEQGNTELKQLALDKIEQIQ